MKQQQHIISLYIKEHERERIWWTTTRCVSNESDLDIQSMCLCGVEQKHMLKKGANYGKSITILI